MVPRHKMCKEWDSRSSYEGLKTWTVHTKKQQRKIKSLQISTTHKEMKEVQQSFLEAFEPR